MILDGSKNRRQIMKPTPEYGLNTIEMLNTTALCGAAYISSINNPPQLLKQYMWGKTKAK